MCDEFNTKLEKIISLYENGKTFKEAVRIVEKGEKFICEGCKYNTSGYCFKQRCKV